MQFCAESITVKDVYLSTDVYLVSTKCLDNEDFCFAYHDVSLYDFFHLLNKTNCIQVQSILTSAVKIRLRKA